MAGPDPSKASELWQKLSVRPRPTTEVEFPVPPGETSPGKLCLRILTESELMTARASADTQAKFVLRGESRPGDLGYHEIYYDEVAVQILWSAARNPAHLEFPVFDKPEDIRRKLTTDEITQLVAAYNAFRIDRGPFVSQLSEPELEAWLKVLMEGASRVPLAQLSGEALTDLILFLVSKLRGSPTGTTSAGSPPSDSSTASADERAPDPAEHVEESERALKE